MSIEFACPSCGKSYRVRDDLAGKRAKCKACQTPMSIPVLQPVASSDEPIELAALDAPAPSMTSHPRRSTSSVQSAPVATESIAGRMPPWAAPWAAKLDSLPGRWWMWAGGAVLAMLFIGLLHDKLALAVFLGLGGAGLALLAAAILWGVLIGIATGSRVIVAMLIAAPGAAILGALKSMGRSARRTSSQRVELSVTSLLIGIAVAVGLIALVVGFVTKPRAFKRPFITAAIGALLLLVCWVPAACRLGPRQSAHPNYGIPVRGQYR